MRILNLNKLKKGTLGMTEVVGAYMAQAAAYFLEKSKHKSGIVLKVEGLFEESFELIWTDEVNEKVKRSWRDSLEATEYAAVGISALLSELLLDLVIVERSYIGTRVDYILGVASSDERPFIEKAKLEVSGIGKATPTNSLKQRVKDKLKQVQLSEDQTLPSYVIVVEFGEPKAKIIKYEAII